MTSFIKKYTPESLNEFNSYFSNGSMMLIELDGIILKNRDGFIRAFYDQINAPSDFWLNWDAFWDTITDQQFWITKPLVFVIRNKRKLFSLANDSDDRLQLDSILIDLIQRNGYYIFITD